MLRIISRLPRSLVMKPRFFSTDPPTPEPLTTDPTEPLKLEISQKDTEIIALKDLYRRALADAEKYSLLLIIV